jgi:hypothetical protein
MFKRYRGWLIAAVAFQLLAGISHSITLFVSPPPSSESERRLNELMNTFHPDLGPGFHPSFGDLVLALSSCFSFVCLLAGLTMGYMLLKRADLRLMKGITGINLFIFGAMLVVVVRLTFIVPVAFIALIVANLFVAFLLMPKSESAT